MATDDFPAGTFGNLLLGIPTNGILEFCPEDGATTSNDMDQFRFEAEAGKLYEIVASTVNPNLGVCIHNIGSLPTEFLGGRSFGYQFLFQVSSTGVHAIEVGLRFNTVDRPYTLTLREHEIPEGTETRCFTS